MIDKNNAISLGEALRIRRVTMNLTLQKLASLADTSASHLGRIEGGTRFPSARVLQRLAPHLGFSEGELFSLAGFLTERTPGEAGAIPLSAATGRLDPYVAKMLAQESAEVQHAVLGVLSLMKNLSRGLTSTGSDRG